MIFVCFLFVCCLLVLPFVSVGLFGCFFDGYSLEKVYERAALTESALKADFERKIACRTGVSKARQYCV